MARTARGFLPRIPLDRSARTPLFRQIERGLRDAIVAGTLPAGTRVPSTRALASEFQVSRTTVLLAFDQLVAGGLLVAQPGGGTFVSSDLSEHIEAEPEPFAEPRPAGRLSRRGKALLGQPPLPTDANAAPRTFSLALGVVGDFPFEAWARSQTEARRILDRSGAGVDATGSMLLRRAASRYLRVARGVVCEPEQVMVVSNVQEALFLLGTLLMDRDDRFWHGDPGHASHYGILEALGGRPVPVGLDRHGLDVASGRARAPDARLAVVSPSGEFPLAVPTSPERRRELLAWAREADAYVIEDDWDPTSLMFGELSPALASKDPDGRVIYLAGLARLFSPVLRVALLVVPPFLVDPLLSVRRSFQLEGMLEGQPAVLDQVALADFLDKGHLESMARSRGPLFRERHDMLADELRGRLEGELHVGEGDGVTYVMARLDGNRHDRDVARSLAHAGVETLPASAFHRGESPPNALVLGSAAFPEEMLRSGVERMARAWETF